MEKKTRLNTKIVVITDAHLTDEATGMAQTLANLFDNYPHDKLLFCMPHKSSGRFRSFKSISYKEIPSNKTFRKFFPRTLIKQYFEKIKLPFLIKKILHFQPELIIVSNLDYKPCLITNALLQKQNILLCVYLMDYISKQDQNKFDTLFDPLMKKATKHIFISKYMADFYSTVYPNMTDFAVIHNPVKETEIAPEPIINIDHDEINFAYAGSLWQMHLDALVFFAKALQVLQSKNINIILTVYTAFHFFKMHKHVFEELNIKYGGFFRSDKLKSHLKRHHALLIASSFDNKFYGLSAYSVQTKVTDYLASGVPVISIGPTYAACNKFINENDCGFIIETSDIEQIALQVESYLKMDVNCVYKKTANGLQLIQEKYKKTTMQDELYGFILVNEKN